MNYLNWIEDIPFLTYVTVDHFLILKGNIPLIIFMNESRLTMTLGSYFSFALEKSISQNAMQFKMLTSLTILFLKR